VTPLATNPAEVDQNILPADRLLVLDDEFGPDAVDDILRRIRMDPEKACIPVLLLSKKEDLERLTSIEFMVDDVLWKPLNAPVTRHRLKVLLELGHRVYFDFASLAR
jgi:DNA-binding response OmpR family regulator